MLKIAILGCENTHADAFIELVKGGRYPDVEVVGVFTEYADAAERMREKFGFENAPSYDAFVGKVDGIMITARHGANHLKYALPYIELGLPMFIDKPITASVEDAEALAKLLALHGVRFSGGSCSKHATALRELCQVAKSAEKLRGGNLRAPVSLKNKYGNIWFYSQHLVQMMQEIFGYYPASVRAIKRADSISAIFRYDDFDVTATFLNDSYIYSAELYTDKETVYREVTVNRDLYAFEMDDYYGVLKGGESTSTLSDLVAPVYIIDAVIRSLESGNEEPIGRLTEAL